ncbi:MAG: choice-of-anchor J domain-containing protein [Bacteroidota bacterium]
MLKKSFYLLLVSLAFNQSFSQVLYSERFNNAFLNTITYTVNSTVKTYQYADVPATMLAINDGNKTADTLTGNYPFRTNGQKQKAWLCYVPVNGTDTFAVSTSWLNPAGTASAWLITPSMNVSANSVLTWEALAPDVNNADGYEVYVSTSTSTNPAVSDFSTMIYSKNMEANTWTSRGVSLGAFQGQTIRIAFKNNSSDQYQLWLDDIKVENVSTQYDAAAISHSIYKYSVINANNTISAVFKNNGYAPVTNLTINYKMANGSTVSETKILSTPLHYMESREISFSTLYSSTVPVYNTFKIWTSNINGQINVDQDHSNDTIWGAITISSSTVAKKVLLEHYTDARCGLCPDAYTTLKSIVTTNTNVIAAAIHDSDNMDNFDGDFLITDYSLGIPSASVDHFYFPATKTLGINSGNWNTFINQRLAMNVPATVSVTAVTYDSITRQLNATVSTTFVGDVQGDYRLNLYIKENNVYGPMADSTDNGWNQYNDLYNIPSSPYYQYGNMIGSEYVMSAASYKNQYVINHIMDGPYGGVTTIPVGGTTIGQTYSNVYSYTLPNLTSGEFRFNADNIYLIGVLSEYNFSTHDKSILNVAETKLTSKPEVIIGVKEITRSDIRLNIYPNPATDVCHLNYTLQNDEFVKVSVYNMMGELVYIETKNVNAGNADHVLNISELRSGNYSVQVSFKNNSITKKLTIIK